MNQIDLFKKYGVRVIRGSQVAEYFKMQFFSDSRWGWVSVNQLAKALDLDPVQMLKAFQPLSSFIFPGHDTGITLFESYDANGVHSQNGTDLENVELIPAGLAKCFIKAYEAGVRKLVIREVPGGTDDTEILGTTSWNYIPPQFGFPGYDVVGLDINGKLVINNVLD